VLAGKGEQALTKAREYEAKVNVEIRRLEAAGDFLQRVEQRVRELGKLLYKLEKLANQSLNELESQPFARQRDAAKFQQVALLIKALAEIRKTPILDSEGNLNPATVIIEAKYSTL